MVSGEEDNSKEKMSNRAEKGGLKERVGRTRRKRGREKRGLVVWGVTFGVCTVRAHEN